ncbi:MAG: tetratricopeptide repeat protein [Neomegalonema sp.]|nr:tetratricopeptide repeat protein [Neomegalonema sp.]
MTSGAQFNETAFSAASLRRAQMLAALGRVREAVEAAREALSHDPDNAHAHAWLAQFLLNEKRLVAARFECERALALDAENVRAHLVLAQVLFLSGERKAARQAALKAAELAPLSDGPRHTLGVFALVNEDLPEARRWAQEAEKLNPDHDNRLLSAKIALSRDAREAETLAREALEMHPESAEAFAVLAQARQSQGDHAAAQSHALEALRLNPDLAQPKHTLLTSKYARIPLLGWFLQISLKMNELTFFNAMKVLLAAFAIHRFGSILLRHYGHETEAMVFSLLILIGFFLLPSLMHLYARHSVERSMKAVRIKSDY